MKKLLIFIAICVVVLPSCGAKKNVATNVESTPVETEQSENITEADSLPEFLREFANDSTIHINWAYGIPFIIDDSVPMFLPPIDKTPKGYVSSDNYQNSQGGDAGKNRYKETVSACGIANPLDSLLWLNKCINELRGYTDSSFFLVSHKYTYQIHLYSVNNDASVIVFFFSQDPDWSCIADLTPRRQLRIYYAYDCEGNLLGKSHGDRPVEWKRGRQIGQGKLIAASNETFTQLKKYRLRILITLGFKKADPNYSCDYYDDDCIIIKNH